MNKIDTNIKFSPGEQEIIKAIREVINLYSPDTEAYIVGGFVRDKLLGIPSNDIDIMVSNISSENFSKLITNHLGLKESHLIKSNPEKSKFISTNKIFLPTSEGEQEIDIAQARTETYNEDSRIPETQTATPEEDANRRDLTINSIMFDIKNNKIVDFTGKGIKDLITNTIRTPLDPIKTFFDDPLRIFRVIRFAAKYNGKIDNETYQAMLDPRLRESIKSKISRERIGQEIHKMLSNPNAPKAIELLKETGLWQDIIQQALVGTKYESKMAPIDMEQNNPNHTLTVWGHTMQVVKNILDKYPDTEGDKRVVMILSALMHDMGKLFYEIHSESKSHPGSTSYIGHEQESKEISEYILKFLHLNTYIQQVSGIARNHMRPHFQERDDNAGLKAMRKFIRQMGEQSLDWVDIFNLALADATAKSNEIDPSTVKQYQEIESQLQQALTSLNPIKDASIEPILNGNEVMKILNIKPGIWMSEIMEFVKELKDDNPTITKDEAANILKQKYQNIDPSEIKQASSNKGMSSTCPMHLLKSKIEDINTALGEKEFYKVSQTLKELKEDYGKDENILRLIAISTFKLLLEGEKHKDADVLSYLFKYAEKNFFDTILCSYVLGILMLIRTPTEDTILKEIGERMAKMSPGTVKSVLSKLPKDIYRPELKKDIEKLL